MPGWISAGYIERVLYEEDEGECEFITCGGEYNILCCWPMQSGKTALMAAALRNNFAVVDVLKEKGAKIEAKDMVWTLRLAHLHPDY